MIKLKSLFRRGSPSGNSGSSNKHQQQQQQQQQISPAHSVGLKTSASASSLDNITANINSGSASAELGATRKLSKNHKGSSKDKLNDLLRVGSKDKLIDEKKELKRQQKLQKQMQQVAQQQSGNVQYQSVATPGHLSSNNQHSGRSKDFEVITFDDSLDVSLFKFQSLIYFLRKKEKSHNTHTNGNSRSVSLSI
jgi:hypothetical protein